MRLNCCTAIRRINQIGLAAMPPEQKVPSIPSGICNLGSRRHGDGGRACQTFRVGRTGAGTTRGHDTKTSHALRTPRLVSNAQIPSTARRSWKQRLDQQMQDSRNSVRDLSPINHKLRTPTEQNPDTAVGSIAPQRAIPGNAPRPPWQVWHPQQRRICNLQMLFIRPWLNPPLSATLFSITYRPIPIYRGKTGQ